METLESVYIVRSEDPLPELGPDVGNCLEPSSFDFDETMETEVSQPTGS